MKKIFLAAMVGLLSILSTVATVRSEKADIASNISTFSAIVKQLQTNYVDSFDMNSVVKTGISAMLSKLDPYTVYFDSKEQEDFMASNTGEYAGIGSYITQRDGYVLISGPREGSPAAKAGLKTGDKILTVDGVDMKGKTTEAVSEKLRGTVGSTAKIEICRPWVADSLLTINVVREKIFMPAVPYYGVIADDLGYIELTQFTEKSADEVKAALVDLVENHAIKGLILDLRDNGGGYLESAIKILGYFLPKGTEVLRTRGKGRLDEQTFKTTSKPIAPNLPLVVLIDGASASASEITAGALQDLDRAVIVGARSFGKGLVQSTFGLPYDGLLKITTAKYYIPSGRLIQAIDYSNRNADGSASRVADSLTNEFTTAGGRIVRDGGGITPDIKMTYPEFSRATYNAVADNWVFDFANKYASEHPQAPALDEKFVTDSVYADFKKFIDPERFEYDKVCEIALTELRKIAKIEGYLSDEVEAQIKVLEGLMKHTLDADLDKSRPDIEKYLEQEIAQRYYYDRGRSYMRVRKDVMVDEAINVLHLQQRYSEILQPNKKK